ncbi:hypothetical protein E0H26_17880 [Micromonospora zingiberis]|uniref:O-antigen ligase domain-containing protein n=1 Tax=Micromonospora zingiberis TaxID=2053011 RepID=A0A4R0GIC2_9ACTN|nr:hypothetical protein [Micromonospora zingiberis]TCB96023.1 hypothetical protein E0H26_17880 [Micromonospora zingiberis]
MMVLLILAAFGPYIGPGVRTEQVAVVAVAALAFLTRAHLLASIPPLVTLLIALIATYVALAGFASLGDPTAGVGYKPVGLWAGLDNLLLPIAVLVAGYLVATGTADRARLIRVAAMTLVVLLALNTVAAYLTLLGPSPLDELLPRWWNSSGQTSTAERAATMGRYSGIFNQPAEAGVMYSLGLIAAVYLLRHRPLRLAAIGIVLAIGGLLTASKIFLLIGLPIALWQTWRGAPWRSRVGSVLALGGVLVVFDYQARQPDSPIGGVLLDAWFNPQGRKGSLLSFYTASRLGENSTLADAAGLVFDHSPWFGFGLGGIRVAYDSAWVEALVMAGVFGLLLQGAIMAVLVACWLQTRKWADPAAVRFGAGLVMVVVAGSMGLSTLTSNRVTTVVWLLIALLLVRPPAARQEPATTPAAARPPLVAQGSGDRGGRPRRDAGEQRARAVRLPV